MSLRFGQQIEAASFLNFRNRETELRVPQFFFFSLPVFGGTDPITISSKAKREGKQES